MQILSPLTAFFVFLLITIGLYMLAGKYAFKAKQEGGKLEMYSCGEDLPPGVHNPSAQMFFHIALFFTIMDVAALMISTLPKGTDGLLGLFYLMGITIAIIALALR